MAAALFLLLQCVLPLAVQSSPILVNNSAPRTTTAGTILDTHNGGLILSFDGLYHLYGIGYGGCREQPEGCTSNLGCGFGYNTTITVYSSPDLSQSSWTLEREDILPLSMPPGPMRGSVSRPSLVHCPHTGAWVLWWNFANNTKGQYSLAVATAPHPLGPFTLVAAPVSMPHTFIGDFTVFVDEPSSSNATEAWVYYTTWDESALGQLFLARLDDTYTQLATPTQAHGPLFGGLGLMESPVMWRRSNTSSGSAHPATYYFLTGHGCCFCAEGSGVYVFTAPSVTGPFTPHGNVGCNYSEPAAHVSVASHGCLFNGVCYTSTLQAELAYSFALPGGGAQRVLVFDAWQQAPDALKGHDPELWLPVEYSPEGGLLPLRRVEAWTLDVPPPQISPSKGT